MEQRRTSEGSLRALVGKPTVVDVGIGVLYFFTSHMVIRAMYYIGMDRTSWELLAFFLTVIVSVIIAHALARPLLRLRLFVESAIGIPAVSAVAALGAVLALVSMLPVVHVGLFYFSGALLGFSCGWIIVIWTSTVRVVRPARDSFFLEPCLLVAVACYFLFRCVSSFSETVAQGFLLALPLVT
ncbi:MAG: LuxR family transcriptional regulator, partial [Gordonibacter sp.]